MSDPLVRLARQSIRAHLTGGDPHRTLADRFNDPPQGCFVSLKLRSLLRGCIGTVLPSQPTLEQEVVTNAIAAARTAVTPPINAMTFSTEEEASKSG